MKIMQIMVGLCVTGSAWAHEVQDGALTWDQATIIGTNTVTFESPHILVKNKKYLVAALSDGNTVCRIMMGESEAQHVSTIYQDHRTTEGVAAIFTADGNFGGWLKSGDVYQTLKTTTCKGNVNTFRDRMKSHEH